MDTHWKTHTKFEFKCSTQARLLVNNQSRFFSILKFVEPLICKLVITLETNMILVHNLDKINANHSRRNMTIEKWKVRAMLASLCPEIKPKTTYSIRAKLNSHITVLAKCYWNENSRDFQTKLLWKFPMKPFSMFDAIFFLDFTFKFLAGTFSILSGKMWKRKTELRFSRHWNRECIF